MFTHTLEPLPDPDDALQREWLLTNGLGAYAMGSVLGCNTRRYHGLFVAAAQPPVGRVVALNQTLEQLTLADGGAEQALEFTTARFRTGDGGYALIPDGHVNLARFERGLTVKWTYRWGKLTFSRELLLHWRQQAVTLRYALDGLPPGCDRATLRLSPMLTLRDFHSLTRRDDWPSFHTAPYHDLPVVTLARGDAAVTLASSHGSFTAAPDWWYGLQYPADAERGQDDHEDYFVPGHFDIPVPPDEPSFEVQLTAALGAAPAQPVRSVANRAAHLEPIAHALRHIKPAHHTEPDAPDAARFQQALAIASDDFVVARTIRGQRLSTIMAGYPWFADWGRDTFIALPGLLLATQRYAEARDVLAAFAAAIKDGLVPNRFDDYDDHAAHYNTVDASLWFIHAAVAYVQASRDTAAWDDFLAHACCSIVDAYEAGTHDIAMDSDGLIAAGNPHTQLTWMDAADHGIVFTPRFGKPVEINALWHHALQSLAESMLSPDQKKLEHYAALAAKVKRSFVRTFWNEDRGCCFDTVTPDHADPTIRPNMIFAASLPHAPLPRTKQQQLLNVVTDRLLTPVGLRTLPVDDPAYHGRYTGDQFQRDEAYHQGTIWPWLIGPYAEAVLRVGKFSNKARAQAAAALAPLTQRLLSDGLGQLHEIHEADTHRPVGCPAQAWSVAELLRAHQLLDPA